MEPILSYKRGTPVVCDWVDSAKDEGAWTYGKYTPEIITIKSAGLVASNKDGILSLTNAIDDRNDGTMAPLNIPWVCIVAVKEVS